MESNKTNIENLKLQYISICEDIRKLMYDNISNSKLKDLIKRRDKIQQDIKSISTSNSSLIKLKQREKELIMKCCIKLVENKLNRKISDCVVDNETNISRHKTFDELKKEYEECLMLSIENSNSGRFSFEESNTINKALHNIYTKYMVDSSKPSKKERLELISARKK